ncbi:MAG: PDDEXK nuclease domain-containing protein [Muribaculaceae bacterium]|nr:PDDEXK nuclease domain-containing protein [Muribaculaceae bacterium]
MPNIEKYTDSSDALYSDVCDIIDMAKIRMANYVNTNVCITYWKVGKRIKEEILLNKRAEYGKQIVKNLSVRLNQKYGKGWGYKTLQHCIHSAYIFSEDEIVYATRRQLYWSHLRSIMYIKDELERRFYIEMAALEHWDTRTLDEKIDKQFYLTTALSRRPEALIRKKLDEVRETQVINPDMVFRSSYFLDMFGLPESFSENELEDKVVDQIEEFMHELGSDFTLIARQKRITVDAVDYKMDLVFFHRSLRRTIVVDLKLGKFKPTYEGQMLLYLRYINTHERHPWEEAPIGLILCSEGNTEHIEYLMLDESSPIKVAQYYTQLPDKKLLSARLQRAIAIAREYQEEQQQQLKD